MFYFVLLYTGQSKLFRKNAKSLRVWIHCELYTLSVKALNEGQKSANNTWGDDLKGIEFSAILGRKSSILVQGYQKILLSNDSSYFQDKFLKLFRYFLSILEYS